MCYVNGDYRNGNLTKNPQIIVVNKVDAWVDEEDHEGREEPETKLKEGMMHRRLMWMSSEKRVGVEELMGRMVGFINKVKRADAEAKRVLER